MLDKQLIGFMVKERMHRIKSTVISLQNLNKLVSQLWVDNSTTQR